MDFIAERFAKITDNEARRIFHGRGKVYPEFDYFNVDLYYPYVLITSFRPVEDHHFEKLISSIAKFNFIKGIALQIRGGGSPRYSILYGEVPDKFSIVESNLKFHASFSKNQNIGIFLDIRPGRELIREIASGKKVLNLFSYTCAFSVYAIDGDAKSVMNVDMSKSSLSTGRDNHRLNDHELSKVHYIGHDFFKSTGKIGKKGPYDLVVIDPPTNQGKSFYYKKDYAKVLRKLRPMLSDTAEIIACLNTPFETDDFITSCFQTELPHMELKELLFSAEEFEEKDKQNGVKIAYFASK